MTYYQITAPHFCAAVGTNDAGYIWDTAPILNWTKGKYIDDLKRYCYSKGWAIEEVEAELRK